ncbi:MAG TPA: hypothetical protein VF469_07710 [Kofleriaceae bacterium]
MKAAVRIMVLAGVSGALTAGCGGTGAPVRESDPAVAIAPSEITLREMRKDAAQKLGCQTPNVGVQVESWAGSQGTVIAVGCGFQITYNVRCATSAFCKFFPN